jgi:hypothetical protein
MSVQSVTTWYTALGVRRGSGLAVLAAACIGLLLAFTCTACAPDHSVPPYDSNTPQNSTTPPVHPDSGGPTLLLSYRSQDVQKNPIYKFMYFVPLISPTPVERYTSPDNQQQVALASYQRKITPPTFRVACEFEIMGKGSHKNTFDPDKLIAVHAKETPRGKTMTEIIDYINFEGEGFGRIDVKGTLSRGVPTVTEVRLKFNARGSTSPVTVSIYDIKPVSGVFKYENKSNVIVARVQELTFKKSDKPSMMMKMASLGTTADPDGFFSGLKATIANLFISPVKVNPVGNQAMLDFGLALYRQDPTYTFPLAANLKDSPAQPRAAR